MEITFKVKMDKHSDAHEVKLNVSFDDVDEAIIQKHALANCVVGWQGQIRNHWDAFVEGKMPTEVTFGNPLFASTRGRTIVKQVTVDSAAEFLNGKSELNKLTALIDMMEKAGMDIPEDMWTKMDELSPVE